MKKKMKLSTMTVFFALLLGFAVMCIGTEQACAMDGDGSKDNPYKIYTYAELKEFASIVKDGKLDACAILHDDIVCDDEQWVPIGNYYNQYNGTFDGDGRTIKKLSNKGHVADLDQGLFGNISSGGIVQNIGLEDAYIQGKSNSYVGGVAGISSGKIINCYYTGAIVSNNSVVGGVVGWNGGTITNCYNTGEVRGSASVGGVAGWNDGTITNCYNTGDVSGDSSVGGVAGINKESGTITNCYNTGDVSGADFVGGVAGYNIVTITNCYYDSDKSGVKRAMGNSDDTDTVKGLTTEEMTGTTCTSYDSWDDFYAVWKLTDSYPILDPHDHDLSYEKEQSCVEPAHIAGYTCSVCSKHYSDEEGKTLIPDADWTIAATGHKWNTASCTNPKICEICGATEGGPLGHKYGAWTKLNATQHQKICEHDKSHVVKENHKWDAGKVTKAATEKSEGVKTYTCTVCKATKTETMQKLTPAPKVSKQPSVKIKAGKKSLTLGWNKIKNAEGYDIFFARCNHSHKKIVCRKVKNIKGNNIFTWKKSGLKKGTAYKSYVKAYIMKNGKKKYVYTSPVMHAYTGNGTKKFTNAKSVSIKNVKKGKLTLKKGKTFKIKAKVKKVNKKKKLMTKGHAPTLRYMTSDKKIATVSKSGKITAKAKGKCTIYAYAHNGISKKVTVTVKR